MTKLIYSELSYRLTGLFFKVHNDLGRFCTEKQYADVLESLLKEAGIFYQREHNFSKKIEGVKDTVIKGIIPDFIIDNIMVVDLKAKKFITKEDYNQMQKYLQLLNLKLGLIVNFRNTYLKAKRVINYKL